MNKLLKRFSQILLVIILVISLSGCAVIDSLLGTKSKIYGQYVQSLLDLSYKEEFDKYMELTKLSNSKSQAIYDKFMKNKAEALLSILDVDVTDEVTEDILPAVKAFYKRASYQVSKAEKVNGDYVVTVTVNPSNLISLIYEYGSVWLDELETRNNAGEFNKMDETEYGALIDEELQTIIVNKLNDAVITEEVEEFKVTIIETTDVFSVSDTVLEDIGDSIIGYKK